MTVSLRRSRVGVTALFFVSGFVSATWVVSIPAVRDSAHVSNAVLGGVLLLLGLGSFVGMQSAGMLLGRVGNRRTVIGVAAILAVSVNLPGLARNAVELGAALFVFGIGLGVIEVAMNDQAVQVERGWGRPIMSSMHALFSVGGAAGAGAGALTQSLGLPANWTLGVGAVVVVVLTAISVPWLVEAGHPSGHAVSAAAERDAPSTLALRRVIALALLAFLIMLAEGVASDWSALHAVEHLRQPAASAALAFGAFSAAMTVCRFLADPIAHRAGPVNVVRFGSAIAAVGMVTVVLSPVYPLTLAGWAVVGVGLSGIVPQIYTAAGNLGVRNQAVILARTVGVGYLGILAGPAVIGWVSTLVGINTALLIPLIPCVVAFVLAGFVAPRRGSMTRPGNSESDGEHA